MIKQQIRVVGFDDAPFDKFKKGKVLVVGAVFRGGDFIDGMLSTKVQVDGNNATKKLTELINKSKFKPQLRCIFLDGIAFGGFNIVNINKLNKETEIPVIVVIRRMPNFKKIKNILKKLGREHEYELIEKAGSVHKVGNIYIQISGLDLSEAKQILKICCTRSYLPEPVRVAHLIASGVVTGESKGNA